MTEKNSYELVKEFHRIFGHPVAPEPGDIAPERSDMRVGLILEELIELLEACGYDTDDLRNVNLVKTGEADIVAVADALGDLEYVVNGAALEFGIPLPEVVKEIHRSNMTKLGADGKPIYREDHKVLKGENYEPPQLERVLLGL